MMRVLPLLLLVAAACAPAFQVEEATIADIHQAMEEGRITAEELVQGYLDRIEAYDRQGPYLNSIITVSEYALGRARELDAAFGESGFTGPLHGIPVIVKDNYDTHDLPTTNGTLAFRGAIPPDDAYQVRKLREAGAIILAKSNLAEFASSGAFTLSSVLPGFSRNPYDPTRVTAGSSGGTGAAVAANFGAVGLGSDTGSSIRGPSSHQALVGFRTTMGLTSRDGIAPLSAARDVGGPMTRTVADAVAVLEVIVGQDPADPVTFESEGRVPDNYRQFLDADALQGARIGVLRQLFEEARDYDDPGSLGSGVLVPGEEMPSADPEAGEQESGAREGQNQEQQGEEQEDEPTTIHPEVLRVMEQALEDMRAAGAVIVDPVEIPDLDDIRGDFPSISRLKHDFEKYLATRPELKFRTLDEVVESGDFHPFLRASMERNREVDYVPEEHEDYPLYLETQQRLQDAVLAVMEEHEVDVLVYPTYNYPARLIGDENTTYGANSSILSPPTGFPAFNVPMGYSFGTLPAGLQLLGRPFDEPTLIRISYAYEQATQHRRPPPFTPPLSR
ncbi:MAG: amidase family protein [Gammaproteobacteria bacterium]|nr:amidase family protein [Gammaproteobacteria bacterium]MDE0257247.1 amidase family protein [Gammaproteobacteria bacterium]